MRKISAHDEREIKDYVKSNPNSLKSVIDQRHSTAKKKALEKVKNEKEYSGEERNASMRKHKTFYVKENKDLWGHK